MNALTILLMTLGIFFVSVHFAGFYVYGLFSEKTNDKITDEDLSQTRLNPLNLNILMFHKDKKLHSRIFYVTKTPLVFFLSKYTVQWMDGTQHSIFRFSKTAKRLNETFKKLN